MKVHDQVIPAQFMRVGPVLTSSDATILSSQRPSAWYADHRQVHDIVIRSICTGTPDIHDM